MCKVLHDIEQVFNITCYFLKSDFVLNPGLMVLNTVSTQNICLEQSICIPKEMVAHYGIVHCPLQ